MAVAKVPTKQLGTFKNLALSNVPCDVSVYAGAVVRIDAGTGNFINAIATDPINGNVIGICALKVSPTACDVLLPGSVTESIYIGLPLNTRFFLSDIVAGGFTTSFPTTAGAVILEIGKSYTSSKLLFVPQLMIRRAV